MMHAHMCMQCGKIVGVASPKTYLRPTNRDLHQGYRWEGRGRVTARGRAWPWMSSKSSLLRCAYVTSGKGIHHA